MSCLQYSDQTFDEGNVFELLQTLFDYIKKLFQMMQMEQLTHHPQNQTRDKIIFIKSW